MGDSQIDERLFRRGVAPSSAVIRTLSTHRLHEARQADTEAHTVCWKDLVRSWMTLQMKPRWEAIISFLSAPSGDFAALRQFQQADNQNVLMQRHKEDIYHWNFVISFLGTHARTMKLSRKMIHRCHTRTHAHTRAEQTHFQTIWPINLHSRQLETLHWHALGWVRP